MLNFMLINLTLNFILFYSYQLIEKELCFCVMGSDFGGVKGSFFVQRTVQIEFLS